MIYRLMDMGHPTFGGPKTRCAGLPPPLAIVFFLLLGLLVVASISARAPAQAVIAARAAAAPKVTDLALYQSLAAQVNSGRDYYAAATETQRALGYPLRPFFTVRLPTLTWLIAALSPRGAHLLILVLVAATIVAWAVYLARILSPCRAWVAGGILIAFGLLPATIEPAVWLTETWGGVLIALSLALRDTGRWLPSVAAALAAVFFRELALPYLVAMGVLAAVTGHRREALGWVTAVFVFLIAFLCHAQAVDALTRAGDQVSPGWDGHGGWAFFLAACWELTMLRTLPPIWIALLLPFSFFGLAASNTAGTLRTFVTLSGYMLLLAVFARQSNSYWILLIGPVLYLGLLFAPFAIADLIRSMLGRSGSTALRATCKRRK
jgi:hypothetical protein